MQNFINPYRPGAGTQPICLVGRDDIISIVDNSFSAMKVGIPSRSIVFSGLRGVGKTVLINKLEENASRQGISCYHIEIGQQNDFKSKIVTIIKNYIRSVKPISGVTEYLSGLIKRAIEAIKSFSISFGVGDTSVSLSVEERELYKVDNFEFGMTEMFISVGEIVKVLNKPLCICIDEIQDIKKEELGALITAIHRVNQLGYPIMIIAAGLPKIYKMLADEKSYSERLFSYMEIGALDEEQVKKAILEPLRIGNIPVKYSEEALTEIIKITEGYPFFVQQLCHTIFESMSSSSVTSEDVLNIEKEYYAILDKGFYNSRYQRCTERDKRFIFAMVRCGELPCTISAVAQNIRKSVNSISPIRAQLINKGIIYPVRYKELDFTVPKFDEFISRRSEYQGWLEENH